MRIRLLAATAERSYDSELGRFTDGETIPCFRCGECCRRWQPLIGGTEVERLAGFLATDAAEFRLHYTRPYPLDDELFLLNQHDGACVFLRFEQDGRSTCSVHEARPQACRDWDASLLRRECLEGMAVKEGPGRLAVPLPLYDDPSEAAAFQARLRSGGRAGG